MYSRTSIVWASFMRHLDHPDILRAAKYINTHVQRVWLMTAGGVATFD